MEFKNIKIKQSSVDTAVHAFGGQATLQDSVNHIIDSWVNLRRISLAPALQSFTKAEITALISMHNGVMYEPRFSKADFLVAHIEDAQKFDNIESFYGVSTAEMIQKVKALHPVEVFFLIEELHHFWLRGDNLDEFLARF